VNSFASSENGLMWLVGLFRDANLPVQIVMVLLILASVWTWAIIVTHWVKMGRIRAIFTQWVTMIAQVQTEASRSSTMTICTGRLASRNRPTSHISPFSLEANEFTQSPSSVSRRKISTQRRGWRFGRPSATKAAVTLASDKTSCPRMTR
jgi:hypothetical protein